MTKAINKLLCVEVVENIASIPFLQMGDHLEGVASEMDTYTMRQPLGVTAGICPFNFPAMIPLWVRLYLHKCDDFPFKSQMFPVAIATGNTSIIKPSERDPGAMMMLAELCNEIGIPPGVLNVVHGGKPTVDFLCDNSHVKAISFVGSDRVGKYIYERGTKSGKRVQVIKYE